MCRRCSTCSCVGASKKDADRRSRSARDLGAALEAVRSSTDVPHATRSRWSAWPAAVLLAAAGVVAAVSSSGRQRPPAPGASGRPALAVGTFDDQSGDPKLAWLSVGLPRMLVTSLAQTPGLDVIGSERLRDGRLACQ